MTDGKLKNRFRTLRGQMLTVVLLAALAGAVIGFGGRWLMNYTIDHWYVTPEAAANRAAALAEDLESYVAENQLTSDDYDALRAWIGGMRESGINIAIIDGDYAYEVDWWGTEDNASVRLDSLNETRYHFFDIPFADKVCTVAITEHSEAHLYNIVTSTSVVAAALTVLMILLVYNGYMTRRIQTFSEDLNKISGGDLEYPLHATRDDELGELAQNVDAMRNTIIQRTHAEQSALKANSDLITALSHDIRNPLTGLIGYMELLEMGQDQLPEDARTYVHASLDKAYRIRDLTGELFRYFLVFGKEAQDVKLEEYDAQILLFQLLGEYTNELRSQGFTVETDQLKEPCTLRIDVPLFKRVVDNIVSNLYKYADPAFPIVFSGWADDVLHITVTNRIRELGSDAVESNKIGLRTCVSIMKLLEGSFVSGEEGETFRAECILPITKKSEKLIDKP